MKILALLIIISGLIAVWGFSPKSTFKMPPLKLSKEDPLEQPLTRGEFRTAMNGAMQILTGNQKEIYAELKKRR